MASMDIEKVVQDLRRRFAAPLPEYYHRRIIFWHDEDREFEDRLEEIQLEDVSIITLTETNIFAVKRLLSWDDLTTNYLVYDPLYHDCPDEDWLLDIRLYSEEFRADLVSIWMDEMSLTSTVGLRKLVKHYREFFNAKSRRARIISQSRLPSSTGQLHMAVMAALCGLRDARPGQIIQSVLSAGLDKGNNPFYQSFVTYKAEEAFWDMVRQGTGFSEENEDLEQLAVHILLTAATVTMPMEHFAGLERLISEPYQAYCYGLVSDWLRSGDNHWLYEIARIAEEETNLPQRFSQLELDDLIGTECFPCINEVILTKLMTDIGNEIIETEKISAIVEKRRTCAWYAETENFYDGLLQIANMQEFFKEHSCGFHLAQPQEIWKAYTSDYYRMDTYYRQFHLAFQKSLENSNMLLDDQFKQVADRAEGYYKQWFLNDLSRNWTEICADEMERYGRILEIPQQKDFYQTRIQNADTRVFVIISDAMRYEVAAALSEELRRETQSQVTLDSMQSIFPSITKFGMTALLPHKKLTVEERNGQLAVLADGEPSAGTANRDKILKRANMNSVALQYQDIISMKKAERSALVKGMEVIYIYHDTIDEASHHSDTAVFPACEKAISELKNMVRIIVNEFGGIHIYLTADHGFLYTYSPLTEEDKADKTSFNGMDAEYGRRYAILRKGTSPEHLMPVKFLDGRTDYDGFAPRENVRIKLSGGGLNFVHGGTSLQEMAVPVIGYHYLRNESREYKRNRQKYDTKPVTINLLSSIRKISNMIFSLSFYQKDAVSDNREAASYEIYFTDFNGKQISDIQRIIADKTNRNGTERTYRCTFKLKPLKYSNTEIYYLVIADEKGLQLPQRTEFHIDIAFAVDDFGFFS